jgi:REP element-mobilizing transposase RayT
VSEFILGEGSEKMGKELPIRKHPRLKGYDYSSNGAYYITMCVEDGHEMLGEIVGRAAPGAPCTMELSEYGKIVHKEIEDTPSYYKNVFIDKFVVMPNHVHMIILIAGEDGAPRASRPTSALIPRIIGVIKRKTNKAYGFDMWQTSFYDEIIRNEQAYRNIWQYIDNNPAKWAEDEFYKREEKAL